MYPSGLEIAANGDVVVADTGNDSVARYTSSGSPLWRTSSADGKSLENARDIAIGDDGSIYVADDANSRIVKLTETGGFLAAWTGPASDKIGSPIGITFKNGLVYVADGLRKKVRVFDTTGTQVATLTGSGSCAMSAVRDADADLAGNVYVANYTSNNILKLTPSGQCIKVWGTKGSGNGMFKNPYGVRVAQDPVWGESVYVADSNNNRIQVFDLNGNFRAALSGSGAPSQAGTFTALRRVAVASDGDVWGADLWGWAVERFDRTQSGYSFAQQIGGGPLPFAADQIFNEPRQVAFSADGALHVVDTVNQRVVTMDPAGVPLRACGQRNQLTTSINWPRGVAIDPATGDRVVADTKQSRLQVWPDSGTCSPQGRYGSAGSGTSQFNWPHSVAVRNSDRALFVADTKNDRVTAWSLSTNGAGRTVATATGNVFTGGMNDPKGISVGPNGEVIVADTLKDRILVLSYSGGAFSQIRSIGPSPLGLSDPESAVMDSAGRIWIADTANNRVVVSDQNGNLIFESGTTPYAGQRLSKPASLALGPNGDVYVSDTGNDRVVVLRGAGGVSPTLPPTYVRTTQGPALADMYPVDVAATSTDYYVIDPGTYSLVKVRRSDGQIVGRAGGHQGNAPEQFAAARALSLDSAGNVYVADTPNNRISKWTSDLAFVQSFGSAGSGPGQFQQVYGVAAGPGIGSGGSPAEVVYAVDGGGTTATGGNGEGRILKFSTSGTYLGQFADSYAFNQPRQLVVHPITNDVYVVNARDRQVLVFDESGSFRFAFGSAGTGNGQFSGDPRGIAITADGSQVLVTDSNGLRVQAFDAHTGGYLWKIDQSTYSFVGPRGLAATPDGTLVVADQWGNALVEFTLTTTGATFAAKRFGGAASQDGVNAPRGMAIDEQGRLLVVDWWNQRIVRSALDGSADFTWGSRGPSDVDGALNYAWDVAVQPGTDRVFVANRESNRISVFTTDGQFVTNQLLKGNTNGRIIFPQGVAFDPTDGTLLVADGGNHRIQRFSVAADASLVWVATYGGTSPGTAAGQFNVPTGIDVAADGTVWVADTGNSRVQKRDPATGQWTAYDQPGGTTADHRLSRPWGVTVAADGTIWIADSGKRRIVKISSDGQTRYFAVKADALGVPNAQDGAIGFDTPFAIEFGPSGQVFVSDLWNNRVIELGWS